LFRGMIPRSFHQVWVGGTPFPEEFRRYQESWRAHHPGWEFNFWTDDNLPGDLRRPEAYDRERIPAERSDIIRLDLLWRHGGVYIDTDLECLRPIDALLDGSDFLVACVKPGRVTNTVIGSAPGHPLLERALRDLRVQEPGEIFDKAASGPAFLDALVKSFPDVRIVDQEVFFPETPEQREEALAVHHSARSWKSGEEWRRTALRAEERLERAVRDLEKATRAFEREREAHRQTKASLEESKEEVSRLRNRVKQAEKRARDAGAPPFEEDAAEAPRGALSFLRRRN